VTQQVDGFVVNCREAVCVVPAGGPIQRRVCSFVPLTDGARWTERTAFVSALLNHVKLDGRSLWCADLCCWPAEIYHGEETGGSVEFG